MLNFVFGLNPSSGLNVWPCVACQQRDGRQFRTQFSFIAFLLIWNLFAKLSAQCFSMLAQISVSSPSSNQPLSVFHLPWFVLRLVKANKKCVAYLCGPGRPSFNFCHTALFMWQALSSYRYIDTSTVWVQMQINTFTIKQQKKKRRKISRKTEA